MDYNNNIQKKGIKKMKVKIIENRIYDGARRYPAKIELIKNLHKNGNLTKTQYNQYIAIIMTRD